MSTRHAVPSLAIALVLLTLMSRLYLRLTQSLLYLMLKKRGRMGRGRKEGGGIGRIEREEEKGKGGKGREGRGGREVRVEMNA